MSTVKAALSGAKKPGVYSFASRATTDSIRRAVETHGWKFFYVDGRQVRDKASFLNTIAGAMNFPAYFGRNWDAFEESVRDLEWAAAPGYVVLLDAPAQFAQAEPREWAMTLDIFRNAVAHWQKEGIPMYVLVRGTGIEAPEF